MCDSYLYQEHLNQAGGDCPPKDGYQPINQTVIRIVFEEGHPKAENNFVPVGLISPKRLDQATDEFERCQMFGLSFFQTLEQARKRLVGIKNFEQKLGTHLAQVVVIEKDGIASKTDRNGHITFHPCSNVEWIIIKPLIPAI